MIITTNRETIIDGQIVHAFSLLHNRIKIYATKTYEIPYKEVGNIKVNNKMKVINGVLLNNYSNKK